MRIRGRLTGSFLSVKIGPDLFHATYRYPVLLARGRREAIVILWEDVLLFEVIEATTTELEALADAGYELGGG